MNDLKKQVALLLTMLLLSVSMFACAIGPVDGILFTNNKFAGQFNAANDVGSSKTAEGCQHQILGLGAVGDASAGSAAKAGGISRIATIDHSTMTVLVFLYRRYCTIVSGE